jgi:hypothetical protein
VSEPEGAPLHFHQNRDTTPVWRVTRAVLMAAGRGREGTWARHCCWTNLFKVAPERGNPSGSLRTTQEQRGALELLRGELTVYAPKRVLAITGWPWLKVFVASLGLTVTLGDDPYVAGIGYGGDSRVIAERPDSRRLGRTEVAWVDRVLGAFGGSGTAR